MPIGNFSALPFFQFLFNIPLLVLIEVVKEKGSRQAEELYLCLLYLTLLSAAESCAIPLYSNLHPIVISIAEVVNIIGHSRNGKKLILNPVNTDMTARNIRHPDELKYTALEMLLLGSIAVTRATK